MNSVLEQLQFTQERVEEMWIRIKKFREGYNFNGIDDLVDKDFVISFSQEGLTFYETFLLEDALDYSEEEWRNVLREIIQENPSFLNEREMAIDIIVCEGGRALTIDTNEITLHINTRIKAGLLH